MRKIKHKYINEEDWIQCNLQNETFFPNDPAFSELKSWPPSLEAPVKCNLSQSDFDITELFSGNLHVNPQFISDDVNWLLLSPPVKEYKVH